MSSHSQSPGLPRMVAAACLLAAACALAASSAPAVHPDSWPQGPQGVLIRPEVESFVDALLAKMSLEEKVGQMIQADIGTITPSDLARYPLGSILAGGNSAPRGDVRASAAEWLALTDAFARSARSAAGAAHAPIPLMFGLDAVHGNARVLGATIFPHNVALGAAHDAGLVQHIGAATAQELAVTGVDWAFAPTIAVVRDVRWGRSYESYSEDPGLVASYAPAMVNGLQGVLGSADFMTADHAVASIKHFLGDGGTTDGRDQFNNTASESDLARIHAAGYEPAIAAGALTVMASYNSWQGQKMHANSGLLTGVLKGRMGFNGFVIGDWDAQEEVPGCTKFDCPEIILAGVDMVMAPDSWRQFYDNTLAEVRSGRIPTGRIDDAVRRILRVKKLAGLFERPLPAARPGAGDTAKLGTPEHRALARQAVRESLVLLKNSGGLLPLRPNGNILIVGAAADDIGEQCGGWSVDWQGDHNTNRDFPGATSIASGIRAAVEAAGGHVSQSVDGSFAVKPDAAIVVYGEHPYAEFLGDLETVEYSPGDKTNLAMLKKLRAAGIPVVSVFLSGRPLWVNAEINASDAFVAAWLPGSEGEGVADLLLRGADGQARFDFTGRLSFSWPASAMPVTYTASDQPQGALFPINYGLSYAKGGATGSLSEDAHRDADRNGADVLFANSHVTAPLSIYLYDPVAVVRVTTARQVSPGGALTATIDAEGLTALWAGGQSADLQIGGKTVDLKAAALALQLRYRVERRPTTAVNFGPRCPLPNCGATADPGIDLRTVLAAAPIGQWQTITVPLACFARNGADLSSVSGQLGLATEGAFEVTLGEVRYLPAPAGASCPPSWAPAAHAGKALKTP